MLDTELAEQLLREAGREDAQGARQKGPSGKHGQGHSNAQPHSQQSFDLVAQKQGLTKIGVLKGELAAPLRLSLLTSREISVFDPIIPAGFSTSSDLLFTK